MAGQKVCSCTVGEAGGEDAGVSAWLCVTSCTTHRVHCPAAFQRLCCMQLQHSRVKACSVQMQACYHLQMLQGPLILTEACSWQSQRACALAALSRAACQLQSACVGVDGSSGVARAHKGIPAVLEERWVAVRQAGAVGRCSLILARMHTLFGCAGIAVRQPK